LGAKQKLNEAYLTGSLLVAAAIGLGLQSWSAFIATAGLLIFLQIVEGGIRPGS
jgi:type IV secretory pathway TrbD component